MRTRRFITLLLLGLVAMPASAVGGGWATVGLSSTPDDLGRGQTWSVDIEVLQHGRTPLPGVQPSITIRERGGGASMTFRALPTVRTGVYRARVVFPRSGVWSYVVDDGFSQRHTFAPVRITNGAGAAEASAGESAGFPWPALGAALAAAIAAGCLTAALQRRREGPGLDGPGTAAVDG